MFLIRGLLDRIVLLSAVLAGSCVPGFIAQYRQRVGGRLDQVLEDLAPFEQIAKRDFGGSLAALIQHHLSSADPAFVREGAAIQQMADAASRLGEAVHALDTGLFGQVAWLAGHADPQILQATWSAWQPSVSFSPESLAFAIVAGLTLWIGFLLLWAACAGLLRRPSAASVAGVGAVKRPRSGHE